jgi:hypothetical protein
MQIRPPGAGSVHNIQIRTRSIVQLDGRDVAGEKPGPDSFVLEA